MKHLVTLPGWEGHMLLISFQSLCHISAILFHDGPRYKVVYWPCKYSQQIVLYSVASQKRSPRNDSTIQNMTHFLSIIFYNFWSHSFATYVPTIIIAPHTLIVLQKCHAMKSIVSIDYMSGIMVHIHIIICSIANHVIPSYALFHSIWVLRQ